MNHYPSHFVTPVTAKATALIGNSALILLAMLLVFPSAAISQVPETFQQTGRALHNPADTTILVAAHRGGREADKENNAPENSIANIAVAINKRFHVYETDIRETSDGVFVIVHDETLERETNGTGPVEKMTAAEVAKLKKKFRDGSLSEHPVATFEGMLAAGKNKIFFKPDLKPGVIDSFDKLARLIHEQEMVDQVYLRTEYKHLWKIEKLFAAGTPKVEVMFKVNSEAQVKKVHQKLAPSTIQINIAKGEKLSEEKLNAIKTAIFHSMLVETHVYNDEEQTEQLIRAGVRMFHSANPDATQRFLEKRLAKLNQTLDDSSGNSNPDPKATKKDASNSTNTK